MMKPRFTKHLCMLLTLLLLLAPAAALAERAEETSVDISFGDQPEYRVPVQAVSLDTSDELWLNGIPYSYDINVQLNPKGYFVVPTVDLTAAKRAAEAIADYEALSPGEPFDSSENIKIISGYGLKVQLSDLPDLNIAAREIELMEFPEELRVDSTQRLGQALTAFQQTISSTSNDEVNYVEKIQAILELFSESDKHFNENMTKVYQLLFDIRAAIACKTLPQSILKEDTTANLLAIFRDILKKGELDLDEIEFWGSDEAWVAYAAKESKVKLAAGDKFVISDKAGKSITVSVKPVMPEPPPPDEYVYEPPPPPQSELEVPEDASEFKIVSNPVIKEGDYVKLVVNKKNVILFVASGAPEGATYAWKYTPYAEPLPVGLCFVVDEKDSSKASISVTPTEVNFDGIRVNVSASASTSPNRIDYKDSLTFAIVFLAASDGEDIDGEDIDGEDIDGEDIDGEVSGVSAPQLLTTGAAPLPDGTTDATDPADPSTLSTPSTLTTPVDPETPEA